MTPVDTTKSFPEVRQASRFLGVPVGPIVGSDVILEQEAQGQRQIVNSTKVPTDGTQSEEQRQKLAALGFKLGEIDSRDPMFREVELPEGWSREGSDHSMWSYIVDERGFRRIAIFYKAAFYDRSASLSIVADPTTKAQTDAYDEFNSYVGLRD
jgi:hypothetical protein